MQGPEVSTTGHVTRNTSSMGTQVLLTLHSQLQSQFQVTKFTYSHKVSWNIEYGIMEYLYDITYNTIERKLKRRN